MRVATRSLLGSTAEAAIASIWSVTFIEPSSAPMPAPTRPLTTSAVMIGPLSRSTERMIRPGSADFAPNSISVSRVCSESTVPIAAPDSMTRGKDFVPISSI